ncbi:hypothetical protein NM688_g4526 [Phlebia brevispora]|uniref:Uncharacterized protein n=1 Tax=Phlebia brevispora TaxID=194682 RepID=A0ACC1T2V8_9APHY|nr:hypothetical protein NM688_g4526 [Phlebia brevispora]
MKYIWLDCDPGHDDATAILLAIHIPDLILLGISTVHGNASADNIIDNAARCLYAFGAPDNVRVHPGARKPLIRKPRHDPEIHGVDGLGGVEGLPPADLPEVAERLLVNGTRVRAIEGIANAIRNTWQEGAGPQVTVISTGPMTNIALFISVYPELLAGVEQFVYMGGGVGRGNRAPSAEFNILCDPEAAQIVLDAPVKTVMIPLNVTHTAIVTKDVQHRLLQPGSNWSRTENTLPPASTPLRHTLSTLVSYFAAAYKATFGFMDGPPLHDALTIAYVAQPDLFKCTRYRVDIELSGAHTTGETVVDRVNFRSNYDDSWGPSGKNCLVAESLNVDGFFKLLLECVTRCDAVSPLNKATV